MMGPLRGTRILEFESLGPVPWAGMMLADMGADVIVLTRPDRSFDVTVSSEYEISRRGKRFLALDLKTSAGRDQALALVAEADILMEGMRPGVMERLGLGPEPCQALNQRLIYGRMTGWGQYGAFSNTVGHDINYLAVTGALHAIGAANGPPVPPLNLLGDFGGGGAFLLIGILAAMVERRHSGRGQVIDAAMVDGVTSLMSALLSRFAAGGWNDARGSNLVDGGAPFYATYETSDSRYIAVGAIEPQFYARLLQGLGLNPENLPQQMDKSQWAELRRIFAARFLTDTRDNWCRHFQDLDACVSPVLSIAEAVELGKNDARERMHVRGGLLQPASAPRFSRTPSAAGRSRDSVAVASDSGSFWKERTLIP